MKRVRQCPSCEASLQPWEIRGAGTFTCPYCDRTLQAAAAYSNWISICNVLFCTGVFILLGFRGLHLLYAILLAWWPVEFIAGNLLLWVIPPKIEIAKPQKPLRDTLREITGRTELNLRDDRPRSQTRRSQDSPPLQKLKHRGS